MRWVSQQGAAFARRRPYKIWWQNAAVCKAVICKGGVTGRRLDHLSRDGLVLAADHPFWKTHSPPNRWGCGCHVPGARSEPGARRVGGDPSKPLPPGWDRADPKTGAPPGIGKGWDHAPGDTVSDLVQALAEKAVDWDYNSAIAFMRALPDSVRDGFSNGLRGLPSLADALRLYAGRVGDGTGSQVAPQRSLGLVTDAQRGQIGLLPAGSDGALFEFVVTPDAIRHVLRSHGDAAVEGLRGQRQVCAADFGRLGLIVNKPDRIEAAGLSLSATPVVRFEKVIGNERYVVLFEILSGRRRLRLKTLWVESVGRPPASTP